MTLSFYTHNHPIVVLIILLVFVTKYCYATAENAVQFPHSQNHAILDYHSPPKIRLRNGTEWHANNLAEENQLGRYSISDSETIVLICESDVPTRWLWTPHDSLSSKVLVKMNNNHKYVSGRAIFISELSIGFVGFQKLMPIDQSYLVEVNVSCVNSIQNTPPDPVTCVQISHEGDQGRTVSRPVILEFVKRENLEDCVFLVGLNSDPNCSTGTEVTDRYLVSGPCKPGRWGTWGFCADLGVCNSENVTDVDAEGCQNVKESMADFYSRGYGWHLLGFPKNDYCGITKVSSKSPSVILLLSNETNTDEGMNILERMKQDSIEIFALGSATEDEIRTDKHEFEENETVQFACRAVWILTNFQIRIVSENGKDMPAPGPSEEHIIDHIHILRQNVTLNNTGDGQISRIYCTGHAWSKWKPIQFMSSMNISVKPAKSPSANLTVSGMHDVIEFNCSYRGHPRPNLTWSFSEKVEFVSVRNIAPSYNGGWSQIRVISVAGFQFSSLNVTCKVENRHGSNQSTVQLQDIGEYHSAPILSLTEAIGLFSVGSVLLVILFTTLLCYRARPKIFANQAMEKKVHVSNEKLSLHEIKSTQSLLEVDATDDPKPLCPLMNKYELLPDEFAIEKTMENRLGSGAFGEVYRGTVMKRGEGKERQVAVKMPVAPSTEVTVKGLLDELTYLPCLGKHPYIVELIGVYTTKLDENILYVFLELCELGSLLNYLKAYELVEEVVMMGREDGSSYHNIPMTVLSIDKNFAMDMCRWAGEIASGMEHIISKGLLHRDLATRNMLLTADRRIKITDFGLTRPMNESQIYMKKTNNPLPWKWMAPECLPLPGRTQFTEKSEVWSFGITLWEIYSLGEEPYSGVQCSEEFANWLEHPENRLSEPRYCRNNMYSVMHRCWARDPEDRPTFSELIRILRENSGNDSTS